MRRTVMLSVFVLACQPSAGDDATTSESSTGTADGGSCADVTADDEAGPNVTIALVVLAR